MRSTLIPAKWLDMGLMPMDSRNRPNAVFFVNNMAMSTTNATMKSGNGRPRIYPPLMK